MTLTPPSLIVIPSEAKGHLPLQLPEVLVLRDEGDLPVVELHHPLAYLRNMLRELISRDPEGFKRQCEAHRVTTLNAFGAWPILGR